MLFIRSLIFNIGSNLALLIIITSALLVFFMPFKVHYNIISKWAQFSVWWLKVICKVDYKIIGTENIPSSLCVVMSNHQSTWDTLVFQTFLPPQTWVIKKELLFVPVFGWGLALLKPIAIKREDKLRAIRTVITQGVDRIKNGIWPIIYPEGTRRKNGNLGKYQVGGVAVAQKAKVDILPIYHNAGKYWPKGKFIKTPGTITITIGKTVDTSTKKATLITTEIYQWALDLEQKYRHFEK